MNGRKNNKNSSHPGNGSESPKYRYKVRPLRIYFKAKIGDTVEIGRGKAKVIRIIPYDEVIQEMLSRGATEKEIKEFNEKAILYLGRRKKYFDCLVQFKNGKVIRIDCYEFTKYKFREKHRQFLRELKEKFGDED